MAAVRIKEKYGFIDKSGKEVIPLVYNDLVDLEFKGGV
ncbi:WG repeat-containing protein [Algoriphagus aestuariicola]|uniref:WG repeat-containing protein n=1 Tax=Algoriphagus aestuariicola TaxID=1852016 RepID=A0ABS3BM71_9BACT|nr:WG repeat-containing protein [Algoriphagus aestuariicola]